MPFMRFLNLIRSFFSTNQTDNNNLKTESENILIAAEESNVIHEIIERDDAELKYFEQWSNSPCRNKMLSWIAQEYDRYKNTGACDPALMFLMIPSVNGFIIQFDPGRWHEQDFICLLDYFRDRLKKEDDYFIQVSDKKTTNKGNNSESIQRHYLKPPREFIKKTDEKKNQKYGNMMISLCFNNGKIKSLKLSATHYNDHLFEKAYSFDRLINVLCK